MAPTTKSQTIDFLGFLRGQLQGLQGIPTLCYELIQNADDVRDEQGNPAATRITFDVCDDALWVENDGVFREIDFERMQRISWGDKSQEAGTTGAFGIGFISVYQITDSPEIFSSGQHWVFRPEKNENERIWVEEIETEYTRFRLPWAFEISSVRRDLQIPPVSREDLEQYTREIDQAIQHAALFLRHLTVLEVKRNGELIRRIEVLREKDQRLIDDGSNTLVWQIFRGDFSDTSRNLRSKFGDILANRKSIVEIAVPDMPLDNGLLFAFLPSETHTGLPFHINADFFPSPDRKRILLDVDYKSEWNHLALECASRTLAENVDGLLELFPDLNIFWKFVDRVKEACERGPMHEKLPNFWEEIHIPIKSRPTVLTSREKKVRPDAVYYPLSKAEIAAAPMLEDLGLSIVHENLRQFQNLLTDSRIGVRILKLAHVIVALENAGWTDRQEIASLPSHLQKVDDWRTFWRAIEWLLDKSGMREQTAREPLAHLAIAFGTDGAVWPPSQLFDADQKTQTLFTRLQSIVWFDSKSSEGAIPASLVPKFGLSYGIEILEKSQMSLQKLWGNDQFPIDQMYMWLESHQAEIAANTQIQERLRALTIWPTADGKLRSLENRFLPGDFEDPLGLAQLVDVNALGGRREFLENTLVVRPLDFIMYVREWVPTAIRTGQLEVEKKLRLLKVLAENIGKLQTQPETRTLLSNLELVWCGDDRFLPANQVYFDTDEVRNLFGERYPIAKTLDDAKEAIRSLYEWLGVNRRPRPEHIVKRIDDAVSHPPTELSRKVIEQIFDYLASNWKFGKDRPPSQFEQLKRIAWLPGTKNPDRWFEAGQVYAIYQDYLFKSQGNFLSFPRKIQQEGSAFIEFLGIKTEPPPELAAKHLLFLSSENEKVSENFYDYLNRNADAHTIALLKNEPCLYLKLPSGEGKWVRPDQVFWDDHPFGEYRYRLGPEFGRYKKLLDRLGVKNKPDHHDAISVLLEIADSSFSRSNLQITNEHPEYQINLAAWQLLSEALQQDLVTVNEVASQLSQEKCVITTNGFLQKPSLSFFEDRPRWAEKFQLIKNDVVPRIKDCWLAMEAAGVRRLSQAVETHLVDLISASTDDEIPGKLHRREILIRRIEGDRPLRLDRLHEIAFKKAEQIQIIRTFHAFNQSESHHEDDVDAILIDDTLYYKHVNGQPSFAGIARELSFILRDGDSYSSLALELNHILRSPSFDDAKAVLDELGYPPLKGLENSTVSGLTAAGLGEDSELLDHEADFSHASPPQQPQKIGDASVASDSWPLGSIPGSADIPGYQKPKKKPKRRSTRLISYVEPSDDEDQMVEEEEKPSSRLTAIGQRGVDIVMAFERDQGREPEDANVNTPNNPGYDIKSFDPNTGQIRYIEVKAFVGIWDGSSPARMTNTEFEMAHERGENAWLYVVEKVESDAPHIYCIQAPTHKIKLYCFDHVWQQIGESFDASRYIKDLE